MTQRNNIGILLGIMEDKRSKFSSGFKTLFRFLKELNLAVEFEEYLCSDAHYGTYIDITRTDFPLETLSELGFTVWLKHHKNIRLRLPICILFKYWLSMHKYLLCPQMNKMVEDAYFDKKTKMFKLNYVFI